MHPRPGARLGPYELIEPIGRGGMGEVYRARDTRLGRDVAIKFLNAELSTDPIIPRAKMKVTTRENDHRVPLGPEISAELQRWQAVFGTKGYVFPSPPGADHIGRESIEKVYRVTLGLGRKHSPHGWRSAFSTLARDNGFARDVVELALDHAHDNAVARAYDRGERFEQRVKLFN